MATCPRCGREIGKVLCKYCGHDIRTGDRHVSIEEAARRRRLFRATNYLTCLAGNGFLTGALWTVVVTLRGQNLAFTLSGWSHGKVLGVIWTIIALGENLAPEGNRIIITLLRILFSGVVCGVVLWIPLYQLYETLTPLAGWLVRFPFVLVWLVLAPPLGALILFSAVLLLDLERRLLRRLIQPTHYVALYYSKVSWATSLPET